MKNLVTSVFLASLLVLSLQSCSRESRELDGKLDELERELDGWDVYREKHDRMADSLRSVLAASTKEDLWKNLSHLYRHYESYNVDSAGHYLDRMVSAENGNLHHSIRDSIYRADLFRKVMKGDEALQLLEGMDTSAFSKGELSQWYLTRIRVYTFLAGDRLSDESSRLRAQAQGTGVRGEFLTSSCISAFEKARQRAILLSGQGDHRGGIDILLDIYANAVTEGQKQTAAYYLGEFYRLEGEIEKAEYWLAQSSIHSLRKLSNSTNSMFRLSLLLYEDGRLEMAKRLNDFSMLSSIRYKHPYWISNVSDLHTTLYKLMESRRRLLLYSMLVFLVVIVSFSVVLGVYHIRLSGREREIAEANRRLNVANKIRDNYIYRYILLSSQYLQQQEEHDSELRKTLKNEGAEALVKKVRNSFYNARKYDEFYAVFDGSFLECFPDFVQEVNSMFPPEAAFRLSAGEPFPTELRILALARLGLVESGQIAQFLKCSPSSVYTYKSRLKKAALDAEAFEKAFFRQS